MRTLDVRSNIFISRFTETLHRSHIILEPSSISCSSSNCRIVLGKLPRQSLNAVDHPLEVILRLTTNFIRRVVVVIARPLNLKGVQLEFGVQAVDVLGRVRREAANSVDQLRELVDVVSDDGISIRRVDCCFKGVYGLLGHIAGLLVS